MRISVWLESRQRHTELYFPNQDQAWTSKPYFFGVSYTIVSFQILCALLIHKNAVMLFRMWFPLRMSVWDHMGKELSIAHSLLWVIRTLQTLQVISLKYFSFMISWWEGLWKAPNNVLLSKAEGRRLQCNYSSFIDMIFAVRIHIKLLEFTRSRLKLGQEKVSHVNITQQ